MKNLLLSLTLLTSIQSVAGSSLNSTALNGKYELIKASSEYAQTYHCSQEIEVIVSEDLVDLDGVSDNRSHASFLANNEGCENSEGDIGPLRRKCTTFNKKSVSYSDTSFLTIAGYVREVKKLRLKGKNSNKLIYSNNITQVPFGIFMIWDDDEFKCEYKRLDSSSN